jgi:UDP-N-acetyl-D-glucosamine dehydrogenase
LNGARVTDTREPDLSFVLDSVRGVGSSLRPGQLVVLESTTYPGTTRQAVRPILEHTRLTAGVDYFLAFSPEREDPGNATFSTGIIPKVVGALDHQSLELAVALYGQVVQRVVPVSSCEVAEACKILANTYRAVNIALVNELKILYDRMGINSWEVIDAAKRSRSVSRRSIRDRAWEATAFPSPRSTWPGWHASTG